MSGSERKGQAEWVTNNMMNNRTIKGRKKTTAAEGTKEELTHKCGMHREP